MIVNITRVVLPSLVLALLGYASLDETDATTPEASVARATPFLMFDDGNAEKAMRFYAELFADGRVLTAERYGDEVPGPEGKLYKGAFEVGGQVVRCTDATIDHGFSFTPSTSIFVDCANDAEIERLAAALAEEGEVLMPLGDYGFSKKFSWVQDRFGVSWQLNLPADFEQPW